MQREREQTWSCRRAFGGELMHFQIEFAEEKERDNKIYFQDIEH